MNVIFCFLGTKHKKLAPDKANKKSIRKSGKKAIAVIHKSVHVAKQNLMAELL